MPRGYSTLRPGAQTAVDSTRDQIIASGERQALIIQNQGTTECFVGDLDVTTTTGFKLAGNTEVTLTGEDCPLNALYAVTASGSTTVFAQKLA